MNVFLVSEDESLARSIRQIMMREMVYCPLSSVITFDQTTRRMAQTPPDLIVAVLPEDPIRSVEALELLALAPRTERTLVVAIGPAADAKLVIRALRGVVDDYLDVGDLENELVLVLKCWASRCSIDRPEGKLVAVLAPSGGSGSSTVATNLAVEMARSLKSVGLIDFKLETGDLAALLDLKPSYSMIDLCKNLDRLDNFFFEQALVRHHSGVHLLAAPEKLTDLDSISSEGVRLAVGLARSSFPFVVVDLDHRFTPEQIPILRQADIILIVLRLDFTSLKNTTKFLEHLDGLGIPSNRIRLVANRHGQPREVPLRKVEEALKSKAFHVIPDDPHSINRANNNGIPVVLNAPKSKIARSLSKLGQMIQSQLTVKPVVEPEPPTEPTNNLPSAAPAQYRPRLLSRRHTSDIGRGSLT